MKKISMLLLFGFLLSGSYVYSHEETSVSENDIQTFMSQLADNIQSAIAELNEVVKSDQHGPMCIQSYPDSLWCEDSNKKRAAMHRHLLTKIEQLKVLQNAKNKTLRERYHHARSYIKKAIDDANHDDKKCDEKRIDSRGGFQDSREEDYMKNVCHENTKYRLTVWEKFLD